MKEGPQLDFGFAERKVLSRRGLIALACGIFGTSTGTAARGDPGHTPAPSSATFSRAALRAPAT